MIAQLFRRARDLSSARPLGCRCFCCFQTELLNSVQCTESVPAGLPTVAVLFCFVLKLVSCFVSNCFAFESVLFSYTCVTAIFMSLVCSFLFRASRPRNGASQNLPGQW